MKVEKLAWIGIIGIVVVVLGFWGLVAALVMAAIKFLWTA